MKEELIDEGYKLIYVSKPWLYFTKKSMDEQTGDDWDDAPYEHNAGKPYGVRETDEVIRVAVPLLGVALQSPKEKWRGIQSAYSVREINDGEVPWLSTPEYVGRSTSIWAGESLKKVLRKIDEMGGNVYTREEL